jgi:hypothetical protein
MWLGASAFFASWIAGAYAAQDYLDWNSSREENQPPQPITRDQSPQISMQKTLEPEITPERDLPESRVAKEIIAAKESGEMRASEREQAL